MKKSLILLTAGLSALTMTAQMTVVKEAEKAAGKGYEAVMAIIAPAMQNSETANEAITYYVPGKAGFKQYDDLLGRKQLGMLKDGEGLVMAKALLGGYDNYIKALPLDTVVDAKGKVKTKYSKEIVNTVAGHYNDFTDVAAEFWNAKDYQNAYRGWDIFVNLSKNPGAFNIKVHPDTVVAQYMFNRALAAWQLDDMAAATKSLREAVEYGYSKPEAFEYGMATATNAKDNESLLFFATEGNKRFGKDNTVYINNIINYYLKEEKYDDAISYLNAAIAEDANNAQYYTLEGIIYDNKNDAAKAMELYRKALSLDANNGLASYYLGRALALQAGQMSDAYDGDPTKFDEFKEQKLVPIYREAVGFLENAYNNDKNNRTEILKALDVVYYNLNDSAGLESVKERKMAD